MTAPDAPRCPSCGCHLHTIRVGDTFAGYCPNYRCRQVTEDDTEAEAIAAFCGKGER